MQKRLSIFFAISTGFNHQILRHRARPMTTEIVECWSDVWERAVRTEAILSCVG